MPTLAARASIFAPFLRSLRSHGAHFQAAYGVVYLHLAPRPRPGSGIRERAERRSKTHRNFSREITSAKDEASRLHRHSVPRRLA